MLKKLFVTAAAAAAVSVPLAGVAWASPPSNSGSSSNATSPGTPNGNGIGQGGAPKNLGAFADSVGANPNGPGNPIPPGQEINIAKSTFPGVSTPTAVGGFVNNVYASQGVSTTFGPTPPGLAVKTFTPGCSSGNGATDPNVNGGGAICH